MPLQPKNFIKYLLSGFCLLSVSMFTIAAEMSAPNKAIQPKTAVQPSHTVTESMQYPGAAGVIRKPTALIPNIVVVGAIGAIRHNCESPKPALVATVTLHNSGGGALAANQGTVYVSEDNGSTDRLVSNGIQLPAFAAGETHAL